MEDEGLVLSYYPPSTPQYYYNFWLIFIVYIILTMLYMITFLSFLTFSFPWS